MNKILCGDSLKLMRDIPTGSTDLVITDPPFAIDFDGKQTNYNRKVENVIDGYVEIPRDEYPEFSIDWITEAYRILKKNGSMYVFAGFQNMREVLMALDIAGFHLIGNPIWEYPFGVYAKNKYVVSHYNIFHVVKSKTKYTFNSDCRFSNSKERYHDLVDVWKINRENWSGREKTPTKLPTALVEKLVAYSSNKNDLILDPFSGSGQVPYVARKMGRKYIGIDIVKKYVSFSQRRLKQLEKELLK